MGNTTKKLGFYMVQLIKNKNKHQKIKSAKPKIYAKAKNICIGQCNRKIL